MPLTAGMTIFGRYLLRQTAGALILILVTLSGVVWIALALRQLNLVTAQGQDALTFIKMTTLALPNLMALIAPLALLVAVIHTLSRLSGDSELIVLSASGASIWVIARPLMLLGLAVFAAVSVVNHFGMPWSLRLLRDYVIQVRTDLISQVIQPGRFTSPESGLMFHIRERTLGGELKGLLMHDSRSGKVPTSYLAESGWLLKDKGQTYLLMQKGHVLRRPDPKEPPQIIQFQRYAVDLERFEAKAATFELKPRQRYFHELAFPDPNDPDFKQNPGHFRAELHERFANPFYALAFVLIAVAFIGRAQSTRQNRWEAITGTALISIGARVCGLAANNLVVLNARWTPLLYAIPLGLIVVSLLLMQFGSAPRGPGRIRRVLDGLLEQIAAAIAALGRRRGASQARPGGA
ncbi:MAG: LPS export ABC transporter permease LptF [Hyphomicrobiaceae bacterium]